MKPVLGVLGGMGPQASARFYELLIQKSIEIFHVEMNEDFPHVLLDNIPVPDLVLSDQDRERAVVLVEQEISRLVSAGALVLAMPCNTMHLFLPRFRLGCDVLFLSMVEAVVEKVVQSSQKHVALLGSLTTMRSDLYIHPLQANGVEVLLPHHDEQMFIGALIHKVIAGQIQPHDVEQLDSIITSLQNRGAESVLLGCTELPLLAKNLDISVPVYDSLDILVSSCCAYIYSYK